MAELATFRASDGYEFYYRRFAAAGRPRGRIVFVHGIRSHGGWYERSCSQIANAGFEVYCLDRRGAGLNTAHRGDSPSFRRLLDDIAEFLMDLRRTKLWLPIAIAGISWGGKLAAGLSYRAPGLVNAIALLCPGLAAKKRPPFVERLAIFRARFRDRTRLFPIPLNEPDLFTSSIQWQQFIAKDRHGLERASAGLLYASVSFDLYLKRAVKRITVPSLLMLAEHDQIIDNVATRQKFENFATADQTLIEYAGAHHTLEFEDEGHPFVGDLISWLNEKFR